MSRASSEIHDFARRLIVFEEARGNSSETRADAAARVIENMLGHQIMFANVSPERRALYFTVPGEPASRCCGISEIVNI